MAEKRDEFTDQNALKMLEQVSGVSEGPAKAVLRALDRNGFVVKQIIPDEAPEFEYGTIESLNQKFDRIKELDTERQVLANKMKKEWNDIQQKYMPIFNAIAKAMELTNGAPNAFPGTDAGPSGSPDELPEMRQDI